MVIDTSPVAGSGLLVDTMDLASESFNEGDRADIYFGAADGTTTKKLFFRAFVYASSQGWFPWRGLLLLAPGDGVFVDAVAGNWSFLAHSLVVPSYAALQFNT